MTRRLPVVGHLTAPNPTAAADAVARLRPDLIIDKGIVSPEAASLADAIQQQTGIPYIILDGGIQHIPNMLETVGHMLGVGERGQDLAHYTRMEIDNLRGRLLITESTSRPLVYYGRGPDGLETGIYQGRWGSAGRGPSPSSGAAREKDRQKNESHLFGGCS